MKEVTFTVEIGAYNEIDIDEEVTAKEYKLLKEYADSYEMEFEECEELSDLYARIIEDAYDEMANGVYDDKNFIAEHLGGEYDFDKARKYIVDNYELGVEWPDIEEEED